MLFAVNTFEHSLWTHGDVKNTEKVPALRNWPTGYPQAKWVTRKKVGDNAPGPDDGSSLGLGTASFLHYAAGTWRRAWLNIRVHLLSEQHELVPNGWIRSFLPESRLKVPARGENS